MITAARELHAEVAELLTQLNASFPALGTEVTDAVEARRKFDALRKPPDVPHPMARVTDDTIAGLDGASVAVRRYTPETIALDDVTLLFLHGGGWVLGGLDSHDELARRLASGTGAQLVAVDYRRAPEHRFPAPLEDAFAALRHIAAADDSRSRIMVCGDSAGANLAAGLCILTRDRSGPAIAGQLLLYPMTDSGMATASYRENRTGYYITADHLRWFWRQYLVDLRDGSHRYASPVCAPSLEGLPPAHVVTAEFDPLRDEGEAFARRLAASGVPTTLQRYDWAFHGFLGFYDRLALARHAHAEICRAVQRLAGLRDYGE